TANLVDAQFEELSEDGQIPGLVAGQVDVRGAQDERLIALVAPALNEGCGLGISSGHKDARNPHDIELEASSIQTLDLLVLSHHHLTALMAAFLRSRLLIFDVISRNADFYKAANQIADVRVAAVTGVGVGDDEGPEIHGRSCLALLFGHARPREVLILVGG